MADTKFLEDESFHALLEYPWKRCYIALMRPSQRTDIVLGDYFLSKHDNQFIKDHWDKINRLTLMDPFRMGQLIDQLIDTENLTGDIVEFGSYKGGSGIMMALMLQKLGSKRHIHLFDSFEGLPEPDEVQDKGYKKGQFKSNYEKLSAYLIELGIEDYITIHKGWFRDTLPAYLSNEVHISLMHVDCDLYTSTMDCFPQVYPRLGERGVCVLDDFNDGGRGEKLAIIECLEELNETVVFHTSYAPQSFFIKGDTHTEGTYKDGTMYYSLSSLLANTTYNVWLQENIEEDYYSKLKEIKTMDRSEYLTKIKDIVEDTLGLSDLVLTEETKASDIDDWDSIMHVEIIVNIEEEFDVKFKTLEIESYKNIADIISGVMSKK